jgi:autophagy-related protein 18
LFCLTSVLFANNISLTEIIILLQRQTTICELSFPTAILAVKMNRRRLIVVLEEQIFLYDISNMKLLHTIDTNPNPQGNNFNMTYHFSVLIYHIKLAICALSPSSENCFIAYPARSSTSPFSPNSHQSSNSFYVSGDVELFDALGPHTTNIVQAHKSPVSCISMNAEGTLLATASEKVE